MSNIMYQEFLNVKPTHDDFSETLREISESFQEDQIKIIGDGFQDILTEDSLFKSYVSKITSGLDSNQSETLKTLMENARIQMLLSENGISGVAGVASLSLPVIRKMWMRIGLVNAIPTEAVKMPSFWISFQKPYMKDSEGTKYYLPLALKRTSSENQSKGVRNATRMLTHNFIDINNCIDNNGFDLFSIAPVGTSKAQNDSIDTEFAIDTVKFTFTAGDTDICGAITDSGYTGAELDAEGRATLNAIEYPVYVKLDINDNLYGEIKVNVPRTLTSGQLTKVVYVSFTDQIFGHVDRENGYLFARSLKGKITYFTVIARLSSENNRNSMSVGFDIGKKQLNIGTGDHINADLPIEWLHDTMAMYKIDGALEVIDLMSRTVAQQLENEIFSYIEKIVVDTKSNPEFTAYSSWFDCRPSAGYALNPKDWLNELKRVIDFQATKMKNDFNIYDGYFVLIGNPLDMVLLPNVNWIFDSSTTQRGGVNVSYNLGAFSGVNHYEVVSTENIPQGKIHGIFIPTTNDRQITMKYYPYTFNVEKSYLNPNNLLVPSIMMTKRHVLDYVLPMVFEVEIKHNDGLVRGSGQDPYWS